MGKLPRGVEVHGKEVRIDLREQPHLLHPDGVLEIPTLHLILVRGKHKLRALCAFCPHKPSKKRIIERLSDEERPAWICRHHDWTWNHKGRPTGHAEEALARYEVEVRGHEVVIKRE